MVKLLEEKTLGVPYTIMVKNHKLSMSSVALKQRLDWYESALSAPEEMRTIVFNSLFPPWLTDPVQIQEHVLYLYNGTMPIGQWVKRSDS